MSESNELARRIAEKTEHKYKDKYGSRDPRTLSTQEIDSVQHEAAIEVQRERRREEE